MALNQGTGLNYQVGNCLSTEVLNLEQNQAGMQAWQQEESVRRPSLLPGKGIDSQLEPHRTFLVQLPDNQKWLCRRYNVRGQGELIP